MTERKQALVRDAIWDAAIDLFVEKGFDETTVDDIAQAAGTSRRSFFRYFESKNDLLAQPIVSYGSALVDAIGACPARYSPYEVLRHTVMAVAKRSACHPRVKKVMGIVAKYPAAREAQAARIAELQERTAEAFAHRYKRGLKNQLTARVLAALTLSLLGVVFQTWFEAGQARIEAAVDQVLATVRDVALSGNEQ